MATLAARVTSLIPIALFILIPPAYSQVAGGGMDQATRTDYGGRNFIVGTVYGPSGEPITSRLRIRLASIRAREVIATTDDYGKFAFSGLAPGTYTVYIDDNPDFESMSEQVDIPKGPDSYNVSFRLMPKRSSRVPAAVVRTENAGIPQKALDSYEKAVALSAAGAHPAALEQLKLATDVYPQFMMALTETGVQYLILGDLAKADEALIAALRIKPGAYEPLVNRGIVYFRLRRFSEAEGILRAALAAKERSAVAHYYLGRTLMSVDNFDNAQSEFKAAIAVGGDDSREAHRMLATIYLAKKDHRSAANELELYLRLNPTARDAEQLRATLKQLVGMGSESPDPDNP